jgi:ribosomal protein S18 acetylase RimI-like enzyme
MGLLFTSTNEPAQAMVLQVDAGLDQHNQAAAPLADVKPLATFATTASGEVVGGAVGRTWGRCCELLQLWVEPAQRARGVGSELLQRFEAHGRARNCNVFYLTTLSFQAPAFYRKHGYQVLAEIDGYPDGIVKFLMHKVIGAQRQIPS